MAGRGRTGTSRTERVPFGVRRQKMSLAAETKEMLESKGLVPRWFNDEEHGERLRQAQQGGWEFVIPTGTIKVGDAKEKQEEGAKIKKLVGTHRDGRPKYAYLMAIRKKWYEEDQMKKEERNMMVDEAIRGGNTGAGNLGAHPNSPNKEGLYRKNINYKP